MLKVLTLPVVPDLAAVLRSLVGVLAVALVAWNWGPVGSGTAAAGAAAIAGVTALQDSPRGRIARVAAVSLLMAVAVLLGSLTSAYSALFVAVIALWCFGAAMLWALGAHAGLIAGVSGALIVIAPPVSPTLSSTVGAAAVVAAAGLLQAVLFAVWPQRRWRVQREALTNAYRSLAADARRLADGGSVDIAGVDTDPLIALRAAFTQAGGEAGRRPGEHRDWYGLPERIATTLTGLAARETRTEVFAAAADALDAVAETGRSARAAADDAMRRLDSAADELAGAEAAEVGRLSTQLHDALAMRLGDFVRSSSEGVRLRRPELRTSVRAAVVRIRSHLDRYSPVFRHSVRLGVAVAVGGGLERFADVPYGYWVPLTVLLVLRPETAHTYTRCVGRVAGTAAGVVVASTVLFLLDPGAVVSAVLAVAFLALSYAAAGFGYLALSAALAAAVVFLINIDRAAEPATVGELLTAALVGGAIAVLAHVLLPDHALARLGQRAGELLKTEIDYAATVIRAYVHELDNPDDALSSAWQRAFRARAAFEAASGVTRMESRELRHWLRSYRTALNVVTASCTTLEANFPGNPSTAWSREFVRAVDEYVESLCGDPPTPASPWTVDTEELMAADQRLRDAVSGRGSEDGAARVLVSEIGTITRHLLMIAVSPGPTAAR